MMSTLNKWNRWKPNGLDSQLENWICLGTKLSEIDNFDQLQLCRKDRREEIKGNAEGGYRFFLPASLRVYPILSTKTKVNLPLLLISKTKDVAGGR